MYIRPRFHLYWLILSIFSREINLNGSSASPKITNTWILKDYQKTLELFNGNNATKKIEILLKSKKGFQFDEENGGLQQKRSSLEKSNDTKIIGGKKKNEKFLKYTKKQSQMKMITIFCWMTLMNLNKKW